MRYGSIFVTNTFFHLHWLQMRRSNTLLVNFNCTLNPLIVNLNCTLNEMLVDVNTLNPLLVHFYNDALDSLLVHLDNPLNSPCCLLRSTTMMSPHTSSPSLAKGLSLSKVTRWACLLFPGWARSLIWAISSTFSLQGYVLVSVNLLWFRVILMKDMFVWIWSACG